MNIKNLLILKKAAKKAVEIKDKIDTDKVLGTARAEAHQLVGATVIKPLIMFSSGFFVVGFIVGAIFGYIAA